MTIAPSLSNLRFPHVAYVAVVYTLSVGLFCVWLCSDLIRILYKANSLRYQAYAQFALDHGVHKCAVE